MKNVQDTFTLEEKLKSFFSKFSFLELDSDWKQNVAKTVKFNALADKLYWIEIFLSSGIAAFGLLQNSVAVVIGAMLIAPLLRPLNWLAFAIATGEDAFFRKVLKVLVLSVIFSIFMGWLAAALISIKIETPEILARVNPTLIDLFVAIFSAVVAVLSLRFSRLSESIAGVAIAAALMPPLAVVGIELYLTHFDKALGAFMLFLTNLVAIILVGTVVFWLMGFYPHRISEHKVVFKRVVFFVLVFILISIPLFHSLILIKQKIQIRQQLKDIVVSVLQDKVPSFKIEDLHVKNIEDGRLDFYLSLKIPENVNFYKEVKDDLENSLKLYFNKDVSLDIDLIRTANIVSKPEKKIDYTTLYKNLIFEILSKEKDFNVLSVEVQKIDNGYIAKIIGAIVVPGVDENHLKKQLEEKLRQNERLKDFQFIWVFLPSYSTVWQLSKKEQVDPEVEFSKKVYYKWNVLLTNIFSGDVRFDNLKVDYQLASGQSMLDFDSIEKYYIGFDLYLPENLTGFDLASYLSGLQAQFSGTKLIFDIREFKYKRVRFDPGVKE